MPVLVSERIDPAKRTVVGFGKNCANGLIHLQIESLFKLRVMNYFSPDLQARVRIILDFIATKEKSIGQTVK